MADVLSKAQRSKCMAAIRGVDTRPEMLVRKAAHALGYRFRLHCKRLPGRPDLVFPRFRAAIFVHGCFWHHHRCPDGRVPSTRQEYWVPKLTGNQRRDRKNRHALRHLGWRVLVIWDCETRNAGAIRRRIASFLRSEPSAHDS